LRPARELLQRFAGEWLAIEEFNQENPLVKIDKWLGPRRGRVCVDQMWLDKMFVTHDLEAITKYVIARSPSEECRLD